MPKIYRGMKQDQGRPALGPTAQTLGARIPEDIEADAAAMVHPGTGGMSVSPSLADLPIHRVPKRLRATHPDATLATGSNELCVWSMGTGDFVEEPLNDQLRLKHDPRKKTHGFVEPAASIPLSEYQNALIATQDQWMIDEK